MTMYKLYFVSKKTGKNECVFRSDNIADCFKYKDGFEKTAYFKKTYYKGNFSIMSVDNGVSNAEISA